MMQSNDWKKNLVSFFQRENMITKVLYKYNNAKVKKKWKINKQTVFNKALDNIK